MNNDSINNIKQLSTPNEKRWVNWRKETRDGKDTKVPYTTTGERASSTDPATWSTLDEVLAAQERFDGIGIVFNGNQLGIDFDHCLVKGNATLLTESFVHHARTYTEVSPSGAGLHLYFNLTEPLVLEHNRRGKVELYTVGRYFTVTGQPWHLSSPLRTITPEEALNLLMWLGYPWKKEPTKDPAPSSQKEAVPADDTELLTRMFASQNGEKIRKLYDGDTSGHGGDDSSADAALCLHLAFWTGKDSKQIERLWLASPLGARSKTQDRADYRQRTIAFAIESCTEVYRAKAKEARSSSGLGSKSNSVKARAVVLRFSDIAPEPIQWLWPGRIALGKLTLIAGDPGFGKSLLSIDLAARISKGAVWPDFDFSAPLGDTVFLSVEDDPADTIRPRLDAAGADCTRVHIVKAVVAEDGTGQRMLSFKHDIEVLDGVLAALPDTRLIIVDPVSAYLDDVDSHKNADVRGLLAPLAELAARRKVAILLIQHLNKNSNGASALYRPMGSLAFVAAARAAYIVTRDKDNTERRLMLPAKNNIAKDTTGMAYTVVADGGNVPHVVWDKAPVLMTADEALASVAQQDEPTETDWAVTVLTDLLSKCPMSVEEAKKQASKAGVKEKALRRAREKMGVKTVKSSFEGGWVWSLSQDEDAQKVEDAPSNSEDDLDTDWCDEDPYAF